MDIFLYHTKNEKRVVKKSLTQEKQFTNVCLKSNVSVSIPTVVISGEDIDDITKYNYMYIPKFGRYYYITDITVTTGKIIEITGKVDVLYTFKTDILASTQLVSRQENLVSNELPDTQFPLYTKKRIKAKTVGSIGTGYSIVLSTSGSKGE